MNTHQSPSEINEEELVKNIVPKEEKPAKKANKAKDSSGLLGDLKMFAKNFKMP